MGLKVLPAMSGEIMLAQFKEEDAVAGKNVSGAVRLRQTINRIDNPRVSQQVLNSIHLTPQLIQDPFPAYAEKFLPFAMAASIESSAKGRLWTC